MISCVLLDLDETLFDHRGAANAGVLDLVNKYKQDGVELDSARVYEVWLEAEKSQFPRYLSGELTFEEQRVERIRHLFNNLGLVLPEHISELELWDEYQNLYESHWAGFADVPEFLRKLEEQDGVTVAVLTNGHAPQQRDKAARIGISHLPLYASSELGVSKPAAEAFLTVCQALGVLPEETVYIGDNLQTDVIAAQDAGLYGIHLNRNNNTEIAANPPVAQDLSAALKIIDGLE